mgnify:CR=1 FL=1
MLKSILSSSEQNSRRMSEMMAIGESLEFEVIAMVAPPKDDSSPMETISIGGREEDGD